MADTVGYGDWAVDKWMMDNGTDGQIPGAPANFWQTVGDWTTPEGKQRLFNALQSSGALKPYEQAFATLQQSGATRTGTGFNDTITATRPKGDDTLGAWGLPLSFGVAGLATGAFSGLGAAAGSAPTTLAGAADASWGVNPQLAGPSAAYDALMTGQDAALGSAMSNLTPAAAAAGGAIGGVTATQALGGAAAAKTLAGSGGGYDDPSLTDPSNYSKQVGVNGDPTIGGNGYGVDPSKFDPGVLAKIAASLGVSPDTLLKTLGNAAPGLLGALASSNQTSAYKDLAQQFAGYGAPYRQRLSDLYTDPSKFLSSDEVQKPVQMGSDIMARSLSVNGNPTGSGNAMQQLQSYSADQLFGRLGQEKDRLAGFGGLSAYNQAAPSAASAVIGSNTNTANALGAATNNIFNPPQTLAQQLQAFKTLSG